MTKKSEDRFEVTQIAPREWVICDVRFDAQDPQRTVAYVWEIDPGECEVVWLRDRALPRWYPSVADVLEDLVASVSRSTRPIEIPHRPPFTQWTLRA